MERQLLGFGEPTKKRGGYSVYTFLNLVVGPPPPGSLRRPGPFGSRHLLPQEVRPGRPRVAGALLGSLVGGWPHVRGPSRWWPPAAWQSVPLYAGGWPPAVFPRPAWSPRCLPSPSPTAHVFRLLSAGLGPDAPVVPSSCEMLAVYEFWKRPAVLDRSLPTTYNLYFILFLIHFPLDIYIFFFFFFFLETSSPSCCLL